MGVVVGGCGHIPDKAICGLFFCPGQIVIIRSNRVISEHMVMSGCTFDFVYHVTFHHLDTTKKTIN